ncbi:MAG TPA: glycosyltransferase [Steroidobacteraceae bacterium]|nr:glycosyltransferase [Steroidobacteraceae bacterium]
MSLPSIAYVVNALNPGGTERLVVDMSRAFAREFDLMVICLDEPGAWGQALRAEGIAVHCVWRQPGMDLSMPRKLARLFRAAGTRIVHAHQCTPWFYAALARLRYGAPQLLLEEHGRFYPEVRNRKRAFVNRALIRPLTHRFVAVSEDVRQRLESYEGLDAAQIRVIYNGVTPPDEIDPAARTALRSRLGVAPGDFVVGTVGRFDSIKNLPMLVRSIGAAIKQNPQVRGLLVGDGPEMARIHALIAELGLSERIVLTGYRDDARQLAQCMDLFVLSSLSEGTSMALLEAMSAGVPVAVTAVGGNPEIVSSGETGWVVPSDDVGALSAALTDAMADAPLRAQRAAAGQRRFNERFRFETMLDRYRELYRELLEQSA